MSRAYAKTAARITLILGVFVFLAYAFLVAGNGAFTFATGSGQAGLELKIDSEATYNGVKQPGLSWALKNLVPGVDKFFNFGDVKPGDTGENTISIHVSKNPAYVCLDFKNLTDLENGVNEPESLVDTNPLSGEIADGLEFFAWHDDGDNVFEIGEKPLFGTSTQTGTAVLASTTYALADASTNSSYAAGSTHYFGITWCAGNMTVNVGTAQITCDPLALGNEAQSDSMSVDVVLRAVQANQQSGYRCDGNYVEGCSPGYWKQSQHTGNWPAPYTPGTLFGSVFENAFPGKTLLQVLTQGGGGLNALGRQTVAALLNASSTAVDYGYTASEVIAKFNAAYPGGNYDALKNDLEHQNTVSCPLGRDDETHGEDEDRDKDKKKETVWHKVDKKQSFVVNAIAATKNILKHLKS